MIAAMEDVLVRTREDFERLPEDGLWEVVEGRAILLPASTYQHQKLSAAWLIAFDRALKPLASGHVVPTVDVLIPVPPRAISQVQSRVPDLVVSRREPGERFEVGDPPELVIEILSTRRGNVERTEKMDDYARAGIGEYWIVNPFDRAVEVYLLRDGDYALERTVSEGTLAPRAFPGVAIHLEEIWAAVTS
jgi:Uma2 family endonuclease